MFKITTDNIAELANGTDRVLMCAPDLKPFPVQGGGKPVVLLFMIVKPPLCSMFKNPCWRWHSKFLILKGRFRGSVRFGPLC
jgi:hypothetical protein